MKINAAGIAGAVVATLSLVAPALVIIMVIAKFLADVNENKTVQAAFYGIRPTVAALIGYAVWELVKSLFPLLPFCNDSGKGGSDHHKSQRYGGKACNQKSREK